MSSPESVLVVGAGAAGLMAARNLARAGRQVTILEARQRCGGRIWALPEAEFGYRAEGGAEFVHGAARLTRDLMREAGVQLARRGGRRWSARGDRLRPDRSEVPGMDRFYAALAEVEEDLPIADFLQARFADPQYEGLRRSVTRTVEGYDAADPHRASTLAIRDEWLARDDGEGGRIGGGYGGLIDHLAGQCRKSGAALHLGAEVTAIAETAQGVIAHCRDGSGFAVDAAILAVPLPALSRIELPQTARQHAAAAADIGFGNVVKLLLRFASPWWVEEGGGDFSDLSFLLSDARVPTWWTQYPAPVPVMTGWYAGPKADRVAALSEGELIDMGTGSLAEIFQLPESHVRRGLVAARAINWGTDPFAGGAYSYATPQTRAAQAVLKRPAGELWFAGEALYEGPDMGTVEAALASGEETAQAILTGARIDQPSA